ncbi:hypothetical protein ACJX0J_009923, partial [Zea mays]
KEVYENGVGQKLKANHHILEGNEETVNNSWSTLFFMLYYTYGLGCLNEAHDAEQKEVQELNVFLVILVLGGLGLYAHIYYFQKLFVIFSCFNMTVMFLSALCTIIHIKFEKQMILFAQSLPV